MHVVRIVILNNWAQKPQLRTAVYCTNLHENVAKYLCKGRELPFRKPSVVGLMKVAAN